MFPLQKFTYIILRVRNPVFSIDSIFIIPGKKLHWGYFYTVERAGIRIKYGMRESAAGLRNYTPLPTSNTPSKQTRRLLLIVSNTIVCAGGIIF